MRNRGRPTRESRLREDLARSVVLVLRESRTEAGVTRQRLAELSGVSPHTIAKIEQAAVTDPGFAVVAAIADALGLSLDELLRRAQGKAVAHGRVTSSGAGTPGRIKG